MELQMRGCSVSSFTERPKKKKGFLQHIAIRTKKIHPGPGPMDLPAAEPVFSCR